MKLEENMDQRELNDQLRLFYEENEKLFAFADRVMADFGVEYLEGSRIH